MKDGALLLRAQQSLAFTEHLRPDI